MFGAAWTAFEGKAGYGVKASERVVINAAATHGRAIVVVGLALFSSRWVLQALGQTDFGLFSVVGSLIICLSLFNSVMAGSSARHFAFAIGQGEPDIVNRWFNTALGIHLVLSVILVIVGWPLAEYVIRRILTIPPDRIGVCVLVFRWSLIAAFINMVSIPFVAMFHAKQRMAELAFWGVVQAGLVFVLAWGLAFMPYDRLTAYAVGMAVIHVAVHSAKGVRATVLFRECRIRWSGGFDVGRFKELFGFAIWSLIGGSAVTLRNQGSGILINLYFGPVINASYGIANQVSSQTGSLSAALMDAIAPEITAREGQGRRDSMIELSLSACKFGTLLVMFFAIPFLLETELLLRLWLVDPPPYAAVLSQFVMGSSIVNAWSTGYIHAVNAHGKIAAYQATLGGLLLMTLPLAWLLLRAGWPPTGVGVAFLTVQLACALGRVFWVRRMFGVPIRNWLTAVIYPCMTVAVAAVIFAAVPRCLMAPTMIRLLIVGMVCTGALAWAAWRLALTPLERKFVMLFCRKIGSRWLKRTDIE